MSFTDEQKRHLNAKLDIAHVKKPSGAFGPKGDYIEGWFAIQEANRIFGHDGWSHKILGLTSCHDPVKNEKGNWSVGYICTLEVTAGGVTRHDVGYGSGHSKQIGDAHEGATKEAVTDALKRALRTFGNPFGLALYDKARTNVGDAAQIERDEAKAKAADMSADDKADFIIKAVPTAATIAAWQKLDDKIATFKSEVSESKWRELEIAMEDKFEQLSHEKEKDAA